MKKSKLGKVALIGAGLYALKAIADKKTEETALNSIFAGLPQNAQTESSEIPFSPEEFKKWLDANPALKAALKGAAGEAGTNGSNGVDGNQVQNFGGSLIQNLAGETDTNGFENNVIKTGLEYAISNNTKSILAFMPDKRYLYEISFDLKIVSGATPIVGFYKRDRNNIDDLSGNGVNYSHAAANYTNVVGQFSKMTSILGGTGALNSNFGENTFNVRLFISFATDAIIKNCVVRKIEIGESVPSNLPYLPTGQEVFDTTTGDRGRYNGTAVDWYTMV